MKEIIKLILKYRFTIIFILLEITAFSLIVWHNNYQRIVFSGCAASFFGSINATVTKAGDYLDLREINEKLVAENRDLRNQIEQLKSAAAPADSSCAAEGKPESEAAYVYLTAGMIRAEFNRTKNYITINKGQEDGIHPEMAVCSGDNVVGIVQHVTQHYASVLPLINTNLRVSAKLKKNGYYGSLRWDGSDYRYSLLNDIPFHVDVAPGDTVVTSGFSHIFPEDKLIGFVESVNKETANFLTITIKLATDFKKISDVYVIENRQKQEQQELEGINNE